MVTEPNTAGEKSSDDHGRVAGGDFGTVRIGIAISDPDRTLASPYENYNRRTKPLDAQRFQRLVEEEDVVLFVVGLPIHLDGKESQKSQEARAFADWLGQATGIEVALFDERFTSAAAQSLLEGAQLSKKRLKQRIDMLAAQIILSTFLEAGCPRGKHDQNQSLDD